MDNEDEDLVVLDSLNKLLSQWDVACDEASRNIQLLASCGSRGGVADAASLPRLNASVQDSLALLSSLQLRLEILSPQHPDEEESVRYQNISKEWKGTYETLRLKLRNANLQAKTSIDTHAKEERAALLSGGKEATLRRRNLQTQAGMTAATESVTESLRRTRQMMVQEAERGLSTLSTLDQSNSTLRKSEAEYTGHRSLLQATRSLLSSMQRHDILDRAILVIGVIFFLLVCAYIIRKRFVPYRQQVRSPLLESIQVVKPQITSPDGAAPTYAPPTGNE